MQRSSLRTYKTWTRLKRIDAVSKLPKRLGMTERHLVSATAGSGVHSVLCFECVRRCACSINLYTLAICCEDTKRGKGVWNQI